MKMVTDENGVYVWEASANDKIMFPLDYGAFIAVEQTEEHGDVFVFGREGKERLPFGDPPEPHVMTSMVVVQPLGGNAISLMLRVMSEMEWEKIQKEIEDSYLAWVLSEE